MYAIEHAYRAGITIGAVPRIFTFAWGYRPQQDVSRCWVKNPGPAEKLKDATKVRA